MLLEHLAAIERVIAFTCYRAGFRDAEAEDFGSFVKLRLIDNDYAVLTKFEGRCDFSAYISVVVQRLLLDYRAHLWGRWRPSAESRRLGEAAIAIEAMVVRDEVAIPTALVELRKRWPELTAESVRVIVDRLPVRSARPRSVEVELADGVMSGDDVEETAFESDRVLLGGKIGMIVREALSSYSDEDRLICRLRFEGELSLAEIARLLHIEQKPLYRRLQRLLADMQRRLREAGVDAEDAKSVVLSRAIELDFGFDTSKTGIRASNQTDGSAGEREGS